MIHSIILACLIGSSYNCGHSIVSIGNLNKVKLSIMYTYLKSDQKLAISFGFQNLAVLIMLSYICTTAFYMIVALLKTINLNKYGLYINC